jgi:hypothetical protein
MQEKTISLDDLIKNPQSVEEVAEESTNEEFVQSETIVETDPATQVQITKEEGKPIIITPKMVGTKDSNQLKTVSAGEIRPFTPEEDPIKKFEEEEYELIDAGIERTKKDLMNNVLQPYIDYKNEMQEKAEFEGQTEARSLIDIINPTSNVNSNDEELGEGDITNIRPEAKSVEADTKIEEKVSESLESIKELDINEDDFSSSNDEEINVEDDLENEVKSEEEKRKEEEKITFDNFKSFQKVIKNTIDSSQSIDLSQFSMSEHPVNINTAMGYVAKMDKSFTESQSVPLFNTGRLIHFTPLTGSDIVKLSSESYSSQLDHLKKVFATMYAHDVSPNKPATFTAWMKSIDAGDLNQLYFGLYKATFIGSNYIGYQKPESKEFMMVKCDMNDMFEFNESAKEEDKKRFEKIIKHGEVEDNFATRKEDYILSDNYAITLRPRSLYNLIEIEYLDEEFRKKYESVYVISTYIDRAFFIDRKHKTLRPIDFKPSSESVVKTIKNKCLVVYKLISSITPDNYSMFNGKLSYFTYREVLADNLLKYHIPAQDFEDEYIDGEQKGTKFMNHINAEAMTPYQLLFTRHQLAMQSTWRID